MEGEAFARKKMPNFCVLLVEGSQRVASISRKTTTKKITHVISDFGLDAGELRRYIKHVTECKPISVAKNKDDQKRQVL